MREEDQTEMSTNDMFEKLMARLEERSDGIESKISKQEEKSDQLVNSINKRFKELEDKKIRRKKLRTRKDLKI